MQHGPNPRHSALERGRADPLRVTVRQRGCGYCWMCRMSPAGQRACGWALPGLALGRPAGSPGRGPVMLHASAVWCRVATTTRCCACAEPGPGPAWLAARPLRPGGSPWRRMWPSFPVGCPHIGGGRTAAVQGCNTRKQGPGAFGGSRPDALVWPPVHQNRCLHWMPCATDATASPGCRTGSLAPTPVSSTSVTFIPLAFTRTARQNAPHRRT